jgi:oligopeptidase A
MIVADIYDAFNNAGFANPNKLKDVGIKYKETFLNAGASRDPNELFRVFRGRNVSFDPFIKHYSESK